VFERMICALGYKSSCTVFAHYPEVLPSGNSFGDRWVFMVSTILLKVEPGAVSGRAFQSASYISWYLSARTWIR
jgi:hypothetical protein